MAARPGSAPGAKKLPRSYQIAIEVQPDPDGGNDEDASYSESDSDDYDDASVVVTRRAARADRPRRNRSPARFPRRSGAASEREVVISISDESVVDDGGGRRGRPPCRVHPGYSTGPAGMPAPRIPRSGHRRITHCSLMAPQQLAMAAAPQAQYGMIGSAKGTRMVWKLSPDGTLNVIMGPPPTKEDEEKEEQAKEDEQAMEGQPPAAAKAEKAEAKEGESPEGQPPPPSVLKRVRSSISMMKLRTAGFASKPRMPIVFETVIGPRPGLTPAVIKPPAEQSPSDTQISIVSHIEQCTCPPPMSLPSKNEHAHCQELLLELLERQEQAAQQIPQINLITPPRREPRRRDPGVAMCSSSPRRSAQSPRHIMEIAASVDSAVLEEDFGRPTPLLHIMEKGPYDYA